MHLRIVGTLLAMALAVPNASAEDTTAVSIGAVLGRFQLEQLQPFSQYCEAALPERAEEFRSASSQLRSNLESLAPEIDEAARSADTKPISQQEFDTALGGIRQVVDEALVQAKQLPADALCLRVLARLRDGTVENLRGLMRKSLEDYQSRLRSREESTAGN